jgi:acetoacetyl-CoA synthetase
MTAQLLSSVIPSTLSGWPTNDSASLTQDALITIWENLLKRSPVLPDDNFFDLGGDSILAVSLFLAIEETTGRKLPVTTIYDAPTVAAITRVLGQREGPKFSPLLQLKPGSSPLPVLIAPGTGGTVIELSRLAKSMVCNHPIYLILPRGINGIDPPHYRVEDMAEYCIECARELQPHGPYLLAGYSFGGLVMLEVAQRLRKRGEEIALLAFLDTYPHPQFWPFKAWIASARQHFDNHRSAINKLRAHEALPYLCQGSWNFIMRDLRSRCFGAYRQEQPNADTAFRELQADLAAFDRYRPGYYPGKITFLRAQISGLVRWVADPVAVWGRLTQALEVHTVPGDHRQMMTAHLESLAAKFSLCIEEALDQLDMMPVLDGQPVG